MEIHPCTIVFPYEGPAESEAQRHRQTIILEAPDGAVLQFDQALDLGRAKVGRLVGGQLKGKVTIRSDWKEPGPEDDLLVTTRDVRLTEQTISTPNPVEFRWGPHFGRGQDMVIKLLAGAAKPGDATGGPNVAGIESFEIRHVERLHLDLGQVGEKGTSSTPVEINCHGPFYFDVVHRVATFRDRVDVLKANPSGPSDQIACELLSLYFIEPPKKTPRPADSPESGTNSRGLTAPGTAPAPAGGSLELVAERLEARGNPVVVTAPSRKLIARGPRIEYNLLAKSITLDGGPEVFLQQGPNEIHARSLYYQVGRRGPIGLGDGAGAGLAPWPARGSPRPAVGGRLAGPIADPTAPTISGNLAWRRGGTEVSRSRAASGQGDIFLADRDAAGRRRLAVWTAAQQHVGPQRRPTSFAAAYRQSGAVGGVVSQRGRGSGVRGQRSGTIGRRTPRDCGRGGRDKRDGNWPHRSRRPPAPRLCAARRAAGRAH